MLSRDLTRPRGQRVVGLHREESIKVIHHPVKFGGHKHCVSEDIIVLAFLKILQEHVIKGSCDSMGRGSAR